MFHGSLPSSVQSLIYETVKKWDCRDVYIACSGNFTIERTIYDLGKNIISSDITLYSSAIGEYLSGKKVDIELNRDFELIKDTEWLADYMVSDEDKLATIMLATNFVNTLGKDNEYYKRIFNAYKVQFSKLHEKTKERISKNQTRIADYKAMDAMEFVDIVPKNQSIIAYPPFFAGDYEKMFEMLSKVFTWQPPNYELFTEESRSILFEKMVEKDNFMFGTNKKIDSMQQYLKGMSKTTNRGTPLYIYSNSDKVRICIPNQKVEPLPIRRLDRGDEIGDDIKLVILNAQQFQSVRSQYMNVNIIPGQATIAIGVVVDEKLIGVYAFSSAPSLSNWDSHVETPTIYMLSDFPVAPTDYDRLAKLVIYSAMSKESKKIAERVSGKRVRSLVTTAFSNKPVSMKYRGILKLLNRKTQAPPKENSSESEKYYGQKYNMNYGGIIGEWTLKEGLEMWKKKHGKFKNTGKVENE